MCFLFCGKRRRLTARLIKAFPKEYRDDVIFVCNRLSLLNTHRDPVLYGYDHKLYSEEQTVWRLTSGEHIQIPYRIYIDDKINGLERLTERQQTVYHCIFSRSGNGYVRERHIKALLESKPPEWAMPYIIKICDEYVLPILKTVYQHLCETDCRAYRSLCALNFERVRLGHCRMISYWNEYHRYECYRYKNYIGKRLYKECFGYHKTGQKLILTE